MNTDAPSTSADKRPSAVLGEDGQLRSSRFGDIYFSCDDGLAESRYVFIDGSALSKRWQALNKNFRLVELGFGTGLNFLACVAEWLRRDSSNQQWLDYIGIEGFPLDKLTMQIALKHWPELAPYSAELLDNWPLSGHGQHSIMFTQWRVRLQLLFDDVVPSVSGIAPGSTDAWFLDGFAPARNPAMWSPEVMRSIRRASAREATIATFTAAGFVRRNLTSLGFTIRKRKGHGRKREMLTGQLAEAARPRPSTVGYDALAVNCQSQQVSVIGAGIAGVSTAVTLQKRGFSVRLFEAGPSVAQGASGNPAGVVYPLITADGNLQSRFSLHAFERCLSRLSEDKALWRCFHQVGVLLLAFNSNTHNRFRKAAELALYQHRRMRWLDADQAAQQCGLESCQAGLWIEQAGWLEPRNVLQSLLNEFVNHGGDWQPVQTVKRLQQEGSGWTIVASTGETHTSDQVVWCGGAHAAPFELPVALQAIRGAISELNSNLHTERLNCVLCHKGYLIPTRPGETLLSGALYERSLWPPGPGSHEPPAFWPTDHQKNQALIATYLPNTMLHHHNPIAGRGSWRMTSPDRMPVVGPCPDLPTIEQQLTPYLNGSSYSAPELPNVTGLWLNTAHGSRGLTHAFLCADAIADSLCGLIPSMPEDQRQAIHPARFALRSLRRKEKARQ